MFVILMLRGYEDAKSGCGLWDADFERSWTVDDGESPGRLAALDRYKSGTLRSSASLLACVSAKMITVGPWLGIYPSEAVSLAQWTANHIPRAVAPPVLRARLTYDHHGDTARLGNSGRGRSIQRLRRLGPGLAVRAADGLALPAGPRLWQARR